MVWIEALNIPLRDEEVLQVPIQIKCRCSGCGKHFVKCIFCDHPISGNGTIKLPTRTQSSGTPEGQR